MDDNRAITVTDVHKEENNDFRETKRKRDNGVIDKVILNNGLFLMFLVKAKMFVVEFKVWQIYFVRKQSSIFNLGDFSIDHSPVITKRKGLDFNLDSAGVPVKFSLLILNCQTKLKVMSVWTWNDYVLQLLFKVMYLVKF